MSNIQKASQLGDRAAEAEYAGRDSEALKGQVPKGYEQIYEQSKAEVSKQLLEAKLKQ